MLYGEKEIANFNVDKDLEIWENKHDKNYKININLPEFTCLCPRSGYPDFAKIDIVYVPDKYVVELKALKLFINSFRDKYISHEDSTNLIYDVIMDKISPKHLYIKADFKPRGNVHTVIEIDSKES